MAVSAPAAVTEAWIHRYSNIVSNGSETAYKSVRDLSGNLIVVGVTSDRIVEAALIIKFAGADGSVLWQKRSANFYPEAVTTDSDGDVIVTGSENDDFYTAKFAAADGALLWEKRYDSPGSLADYPSAVVVDSNDDVIVAGESETLTPSYGYVYYTAKYASANGALLWERRHPRTGGSEDGARAVALDASNNVFVTGSSYGAFGSEDSDILTIKYAASNGTTLWEQRYSGLANSSEGAGRLAVDISGDVIVVGSSYTNDSPDFYTAKYAGTNGALLWDKRYNGSGNDEDIARGMALDASGNVLVTGYSDGGSGSAGDYYTAKYAALNGALLWEKRYDGPGHSTDDAHAIGLDGNGNVVVSGFSRTGTHDDFYTTKYAAADGAFLWEKRYAGLAVSDTFLTLAIDGTGDVFTTGTSLIGKGNDFYTAKYASGNGALLWERRINGPGNSDDFAQAVAVDGAGNVAVTGFSTGDGTAYDYYTAKYSAAGMFLWEQRYNGPSNLNDQASAVAMDSVGNVIVTGFSDSVTSNRDYFTAKYAAENGALIWEKRYNGTGDGFDNATAIAVDAGNNVIVTGSSKGTVSGTDYYTVKYAAADGVPLWEKRYNGPAVGFDRGNESPVAVAVDGSGNVVVTGQSDGGASGGDYYTAKYAAADGALVWERRFTGTSNHFDSASALALDSQGNVIVTGNSSLGSGFDKYDYYTAKYAAADGALLWEQRYNGLANNHDEARAVAVDPNGNVLVTGISYTNSSAYECRTIKYAAANGALLWAKADGGYGAAVAVQPNGDAVVTGYAVQTVAGGQDVGDFRTLKYSAEDGSLVWKKFFSGPPRGFDVILGNQALALGPNGMVAIAGYSDANPSFSYIFDIVTIVYRESLSIDLVPAGALIQFTGTPGQSYSLEQAPSITGPWTTNITLIAPVNGVIQHTNTPATGPVFYRMSTQ